MKPVTIDDPHAVFDRVPFLRLLGARRAFSQSGRARVVLEPKPKLGNVIGAVHGGAVVTLLDVAMASAAVSAVDFTRTAVTLHLDTHFIEPGRGTLNADGELLRRDDALAWCRARLTDGEGRLVAQAQGTFRYLPLPAATTTSAAIPT